MDINLVRPFFLAEVLSVLRTQNLRVCFLFGALMFCVLFASVVGKGVGWGW